MQHWNIYYQIMIMRFESMFENIFFKNPDWFEDKLQFNIAAEARECCTTTSMRKVELELEFNILSGSGFLSLSAAAD